MEKAPDAFRTISEVADDLDIPAHVLRFWETRFVQIKPMKRSGGRRYYRPDDVELLRGIRRLLYGEGYTIRGVQRILREHGVKAVQNLEEGMLAPVARSTPSFDRTDDYDADLSDAPTKRNGHAPTVEDEAEAEEDDADEKEAGVPDFPGLDRIDPIRPTMSRPLPEIPVAAMPDTAPSISPAATPPLVKNTVSGAEAYAPPKIRNSLRPSGRDKLQAVLEDLLNARALIDRALGS